MAEEYHCPACGSPLRLRHAREGQRPFWGCGAYPRCSQVFDGDEESGPGGRFPQEGEPIARAIQEAKESLWQDMETMGLSPRVRRAYRGQLLDTEDLLEVGRLRGQLNRMERLRRAG